MSFQSIEFLIFFAITFVLYWFLAKPKLQNLLLLIASYYFVGKVNYWFAIILAVVTISNFLLGILIEKNKRVLLGGVFLNVLFLGVFKYFDFFVGGFSEFFSTTTKEGVFSTFDLIVPLGISFFTFTNISYLVDVSKKKIKASRKFTNFALYISYFPKFISGPIERAGDILPQLKKRRSLSNIHFTEAFSLIIWGSFKKLVIADNLGIVVSKIFFLEAAALPLIIVGTVLFAFQLYSDFSGYSDIAVGLSSLLGIKITNNFQFPYISKTPSEFWKRWHISLSTWIKDYLYIPLGGSRAGNGRTYLNLLIAFGLSGLWHGASWNYVLWGLYWGFLLIIERLFRPLTERVRSNWLSTMIGVPATFALVNIGWLLFYETDLHYLKKYLGLLSVPISNFEWQMAFYILINNSIYLIPLLFNLLIWIFTQKLIEKRPTLHFVLRHAANAILIVLIILLSTNVQGDFIYADF